MTRRIKTWADAHGAAFHPVHPSHETVLGVPCVATVDDIPGDIDLAIILTGDAVGAFADVVARKAKFAVIFAAGFSESGADGAALEQDLSGLVESGDTRLLGPNTNLNAFEDFRTDLDGPSIALVTQSGHQGRPVFQGQELGIRLSHWAPTGQRGRPRVRRLRALLRRPARGRCRRGLHRGLQGRSHASCSRRTTPRGCTSRSSA